MKRFLLLFAFIWAFGSAVSSEPGDTPLPPAPQDAPLSKYSPVQPYRPVADNLLGRQERDDVVDGLRIQILYFLVGPGRTSAAVTLNGASNHIVLTGTGRLTYQESDRVIQREFQPGSNWFLLSDQLFSIENLGRDQIDLRVTIVSVAP